MVSVYRIIKFGIQNFWRNKLLSFVSVTIMVLALLTVSLFTVLNIIVGMTIQAVREKIDIEVFFKPDVEEKQILNIRDQLSDNSLVKQAEYISKTQALEIYKERYKDNMQLLESIDLDENPLPASIKIGVNNPDKIGVFADEIKANYDPLIQSVSYQSQYKDVIEKLLRTTNSVKKAGIGLSIIFILISIIVVLNTIRITIFTRKDEIEIMKLVGATNWFIRWPFIIEGMIYGTLATIFSVAILALGMKFATPALSRFMGEFSVGFITYFNTHALQIVALQLVISVLIGMISSMVVISRHLKI